MAAGACLDLAAGEEPRLISVVAGELAVEEGAGKRGANLRRGDNVLAPYCGRFAFRAVGPSVVLVTDRFAG
jgi:hypothetical protein